MMGKYKKINVEQAGSKLDGLLREKGLLRKKQIPATKIKKVGSGSLSEAEIKKLMKILQS